MFKRFRLVAVMLVLTASAPLLVGQQIESEDPCFCYTGWVEDGAWLIIDEANGCVAIVTRQTCNDGRENFSGFAFCDDGDFPLPESCSLQ